MAVRVAFKRQTTMSPKMTGEGTGSVMALVKAVIFLDTDIELLADETVARQPPRCVTGVRPRCLAMPQGLTDALGT